jgi:hypothetical protein
MSATNNESITDLTDYKIDHSEALKVIKSALEHHIADTPNGKRRIVFIMDNYVKKQKKAIQKNESGEESEEESEEESDNSDSEYEDSGEESNEGSGEESDENDSSKSDSLESCGDVDSEHSVESDDSK